MIGLAILGIIAVFALPKLIQNFEDVRQKSILKETVTALTDATAQLAMNGSTATGDSFDAYRPLLNFERVDNGTNTEQPCLCVWNKGSCV
ncbi:MAG: type II secretion system protein [Vampirovibrionales bacterium]